MKNSISHNKFLIFLLIFLNFFNILSAKNTDKFSNSKDLSNYFSGLVAINDNKYKSSYSYFKLLNNLEESHYPYSQYFLYSNITLKKFKESANYAKKLEKKKLDNFESNLVAGVYYLGKKESEKAKIYFEKLKNQSQPGTIQDLLSSSLNTWSNFNDLTSTILGLKKMSNKFDNIRSIQEVFAYCYFDSKQTDQMFEKLVTNSKINYSRYYLCKLFDI